MCGPRLWRVGKGVLELLISNGSGTFDPGDLDLLPSDPKINKFPLLYMMDVWTKIEEDRSRGLLVIGRKQKGYRPTDRQTDGHVQSKMPSLLRRGHNNNQQQQTHDHKRWAVIILNANNIYIYFILCFPLVYMYLWNKY